MNAHPHRRFNPLRREWILVSPQRTDRPWQGHVDRAPQSPTVPFDPGCYLCPGNERTRGARNPSYTSTFAFDNDFPALVAEGGAPHDVEPWPAADLFVAEPARGICRVICFSPRHDLTLARMDAATVRPVLDTWIAECAAAAAHPWIKYVLLFENRGEVMGASNPHPHCQLWATDHVPNDPARERASFEAYREERGRCLLCDYLSREREIGERVVVENDPFVVVVPFWAVWPFETLIMSRRHLGALDELSPAERDALADILRRLARRYDGLFDTPCPYSMGFHQSPVNDGPSDGWHLHAHCYPPLLRSATVRKFMVGFELLGSPQRDLTPEAAAAHLRAQSR